MLTLSKRLTPLSTNAINVLMQPCRRHIMKKPTRYEVKNQQSFPRAPKITSRTNGVMKEDGVFRFYSKCKEIEQGPKKLNLAAQLIRNMRVSDAERELQFHDKKAASFVLRHLKKTVASCWGTYKHPPDNLYVAEAYVTKGQRRKTVDIKGRGRHGMHRHDQSQLYLTLREGPKKHVFTKKKIGRKILLPIQPIPMSL